MGFFPFAPGTMGSLVAVFLGYLLDRYGGFLFLFSSTLIIFGIGIFAVGNYIKNFSQSSDPKEVIIDEVIGQWIAYLPVSFMIDFLEIQHSVSSIYLWLCAFICFRFFDILKPWPINWIDQKHSTASVIFDDIFAGVYAAIATIIFFISF